MGYKNWQRQLLNRRAFLVLSLALVLLVQGCDQIDDFLNPDEPMPSADFHVRIENISHAFPFIDSGVFNTPVSESSPGPAVPGAAYEFTFHAAPGHRFSFATMFVQSNDLFFGPSDTGLELFDGAGMPVTGDVTSQIHLWDAGTEVNEEPGIGPNQAPRQAGPNTGATEDGPVQLVDDGHTYPATVDAIRVTLDWDASEGFTALVENIAGDDSVILAPGVYVVHADGSPLFTANMPDYGEGLETIAEDGSPDNLAAVLAAETGVTTILAPGAWAVHGTPGVLFDSGHPDRGAGLEMLAEDGSPDNLASAIANLPMIAHSDVFNTPVGSAGPGVVAPGDAYEFSFTAIPGTRLSFATMFVQSNDLFYAPSDAGLELFDASGVPVAGDVTSHIMLWDAGTEVNEVPGVGANQAPRQSGPNTGQDEGGPVQPVDDGYMYPQTMDSIRVTISLR